MRAILVSRNTHATSGSARSEARNPSMVWAPSPLTSLAIWVRNASTSARGSSLVTRWSVAWGALERTARTSSCLVGHRR